MDDTRSKGVREGTGEGEKEGRKKKALLLLSLLLLLGATGAACFAAGSAGGCECAPAAGGGAGMGGGEDLSAITYSLSFDTDGGTPIAPQAVFKGETAHKPSDPAKAGMEFAGWYRDASLSVPWSFDDDVTGNMVLYAKWASESREAGPTYKVSFDAMGGSALPDATGIAPGSRIVAPPKPARDGYRQTEWYRDDALTERWDFSTDRVTCDTTLYAGWVEVYALRYHFPIVGVAEADWRVEASHFAIGDEVDLMRPERDPYTFGGWFKMPWGVNYGPGNPAQDNLTPYPDGTQWSLADDMDLYAHWEGSPFVEYIDSGINGGIRVRGYDVAATHLVIPEYYQGLPVTEVMGSAFYFCKLLRYVRLPDTVISINPSAFEGLSYLTDMNIPSSLMTIGTSAFKGTAISWKDPVFPPGLMDIWGQAFYNCPWIEGDLTLPSSLRYIRDEAFKDCPGLSSVHIQSETVAQGRIGQNVFGGTTDAVIYVDAASAGASWDPSWSGSCRVVYLRSQP
jgi:uncharacterized repeat protein (TIGR02543 family)